MINDELNKVREDASLFIFTFYANFKINCVTKMILLLVSQWHTFEKTQIVKIKKYNVSCHRDTVTFEIKKSAPWHSVTVPVTFEINVKYENKDASWHSVTVTQLH